MIHTLEYLPTDSLIPYARNSRTHSDAQVAQVAGSIREFGFTNPVLIDAEDGIIAGHGRVLAALKLKLETVPCIRLSHLSETQRKAYIIADNKLALNSGWDEEMLLLEFADLEAAEFDMELLGFTDEELASMKPEQIPEGLTDEDYVPEVQPDPVSKLGDVWILGNHRVMCGDSTSIDAVEMLMDGQKADMVFTDPPYGMSYGGGRSQGSTHKGAHVNAHGPIMGDDKTGDDLIALVRDALASSVAASKSGSATYV